MWWGMKNVDMSRRFGKNKKKKLFFDGYNVLFLEKTGSLKCFDQRFIIFRNELND